MKKLVTLTAAAAIAAFGFTGTAQADEFADEVAGATGVSPDACCNDPNDALGAPDASGNSLANFVGFVTIRNPGPPGTLTLNFKDNLCLEDGSGASPDLRVHEFLGDTENFTVAVGLQGGALSATVAGNGQSAVNGSPGELIELNGVAAGAFFNQVQITSLNNIGTSPGTDIDAVECFSTLDQADIVKDTVLNPADTGGGNTGDKDTVFFGLDTQQFKAFTITITNNTGIAGGLSGLTFIDATGAEWDLDPVVEDGVNGCSGNAEVCDGVDVTSEPSAGDCTATGAEHTTQGKSGKEKLQPDIITVTAGGLDDGESCTITAWVMTDLKKGGTRPGRGNSPMFAPTDCPVPLNDGVKVFDASMNLLLQDDDDLIFSDEVGNTCEIP